MGGKLVTMDVPVNYRMAGQQMFGPTPIGSS